MAAEKSPYLLQHAENPVDWYPWGEEALNRARVEDKPILVSIGYSACHWCHVMAHESFENAETARMMNELFVNIKVDREERPDVDAIYMEAVQALSGQGGWPLNVFLTPDKMPFFGGTYFPPSPRHGLASWPQLVQAVSDAYSQRRGDVERTAASLTQAIREGQQLHQSGDLPTSEQLTAAFQAVADHFDLEFGGFGRAPKFPQPMALEWVLQMAHRLGDSHAQEFVLLTLDKMADGGIHDQLGGGFHRYSVDGQWVAPHFEKMLYDNALLSRVYLHAYQLTKQQRYRDVVEDTLDYVLHHLRSPEGAFYSAQDADSEGVEGKFYVWTLEELKDVLGAEEFPLIELRYDISESGNFEGKIILTIARSVSELAEQLDLSPELVELQLDEASEKLLAARADRVPPATDTKILVSWNALIIRALAEAGCVLDRADYLTAAREASRFIREDMRVKGRLIRSYKDGPSSIAAFLEDYAYLAEALVTLYETTNAVEYLREAQGLSLEMVSLFRDDGIGGFYDTGNDAADLIIRPRNFFDNPIPSGNASATSALLRLAAITGDESFTSWAQSAFRATRELISRAPLGFAYLLSALDFYLSSPVQIAIVGDPDAEDTKKLIRTMHNQYIPNKVLAVGEGDEIFLLAGRERVNGAATAYVCEHFACRLPVTHPADLEEMLSSAVTASR